MSILVSSIWQSFSVASGSLLLQSIRTGQTTCGTGRPSTGGAGCRAIAPKNDETKNINGQNYSKLVSNHIYISPSGTLTCWFISCLPADDTNLVHVPRRNTVDSSPHFTETHFHPALLSTVIMRHSPYISILTPISI